MKNEKEKRLGQYFTKNLLLQKTILDFIQNSPDKILEPCIGQGHIVSYIIDKRPAINFTMIEIDETIELLPDINRSSIQYDNFLTMNITENYDTIVGNPPYVRTKTGNLYIDFIAKCVQLLKPRGELIFIVPSDFFKLTCSSRLITDMIASGTFTHIYHPHNEKMFENANIDILIFRYCNDTTLTRETVYNGTKMQLNYNNGLVTFTNFAEFKTQNVEDLFQICVGLVTGKEDVYKHETLGNIEVLNGEKKLEKYIFTEKFPTENIIIDTYLLEKKAILLNRAIRKFTEKNWFEWGAPRNIGVMRTNIGKPCIYIYTLTRKETIAFLGKVQYFGGGLLMLLPKNNISDTKLKEVVDYLNSLEFKLNFTFSGRFKIGQRQLCNCRI